jgi:nucleotide-binding universal stress UspA family protein
MSTQPAHLVLIAYDGSENAKRAIEYAGRYLSADRAVVLTAWEPLARQAARMSGLSGVLQPGWLPDAVEEDIAHSDAKSINAEGLDLARDAGLLAEGRCVETVTTVWAAIVDVAEELGADVIVTGTRGTTGVKALLQSSVAEHVLRHCHRPVLIVPPGQKQPRANEPAQ